MKKTIQFLFHLLFFLLPSCLSVSSSEALDSIEASIPSAMAAGLLETAVFEKKKIDLNPNIVFSPFSIFAPLAVAAEGATGETQQKLQVLIGDLEAYTLASALGDNLFAGKIERLKANALPGDVSTLGVISRVYVDDEMSDRPSFQQFKKRVECKFKGAGSGVYTADFSAEGAAETAEEMNSIVRELTRGKINNLMQPSMVRGARLVLLNAVYFKAHWVSPFYSESNKKDPFFVMTPLGEQQREVVYMQQDLIGDDVFFYKEEGLEVVGLRYDYPGTWLFLYKPQDLAAFERQLAADPSLLSRLAGSAREQQENLQRQRMLRLSLPRFHLTAEDNRLNVMELLDRVGVAQYLRPGSGGFNGISGDGSLFVSSYEHQADININEQGTEAAAATSATFTDGVARIPTEIETIIFNKPFLFEVRLQRHIHAAPEHDLIVFAGRLGDPKE